MQPTKQGVHLSSSLSARLSRNRTPSVIYLIAVSSEVTSSNLSAPPSPYRQHQTANYLPDSVPHLGAEFRAGLVSNTLSYRDCCHTSRLSTSYDASPTKGLMNGGRRAPLCSSLMVTSLHHVLRQLRRFATTRFSHDHHDLVLP